MVKKLEKDELITLLGQYLSLLPPRWQTMQSYISMYISIVSSILGVTIAGFATFSKFPTILFLCFGPIISFWISRMAKIAVQKQDEHIKELIVLIGKLEYEVGLYGLWNETKDELKPWKKDKSFLYPNWIDLRIKSGDESEDFVKNLGGSSAKLAYNMFVFFQVISILLLILIPLLPLVS